MPRSTMNFTRRELARPLAIALAILLALAVTPALAATAHTVGKTTNITITKFSAAGSKITLDGRVSLSASAVRKHKRPALLITVSDTHDKADRFTAKLDARDRFSVVHETKLSGALRLTIAVTISGRSTGKSLTRTLDIASSGATGTGSTPGGTTTTTTPPGSGTSPTSPETSGPVALEGTFDITIATNGNTPPKGSWFEMLDADEQDRAPLENGNSPLANKDFTPLSPGTSGGLLTTAYQPAPSPAFSAKSGSKEVGNALANEIMLPQEFFGFNFSVVTEKTDPQNGEGDPLPHIVDDAGQLSGQVTAWAVGWNGEWFNQGSPKPNGKLPSGTAAPTGTYDAATGQYELEWKSVIIGGPFNGFLGSWHLEGKFVPPAS
jgi:hypothetical protein